MPRVVIDTDGLRTLARYTQGAIDEVVRIRTELLRVQSYVDNGPGKDAFGPLLAALNDFCTVLADDRHQLATEAATVDAEEGIDPGSVAAPAAAAAVSASVLSRMLMSTRFSLLEAPAPPPQPWNTTWVTGGGVIPVGVSTRNLPPRPDDAGIDAQWQERSDTDNPLGHNSSSVSVRIHGAAGSGTWESTDARGNTSENWEQYQELVVSASAQTSGNLGPVNYQGQATVEAGAVNDVHVWVTGGPDGYGAGGTADAKVYVDATASGAVGADDVGSVQGNVGAEAAAQAHAEAHGSVSERGITGGAGAQASSDSDVKLGGSGELGPLKGGREISVGTGVGVGAHGSFSLSLDDIGFDFGGNLGLGISLGIDTSLHFSPSGLVHGVESMFSGDNPLQSSGQEWHQQDAAAAQADADRAADHAADTFVDQQGTVGDRPGPAPAVREAE